MRFATQYKNKRGGLGEKSILAFDTSSSRCALVLQHGDDVIIRDSLTPMKQGNFILPMINKLLQDNNLTINQIDAIGFGCGPGSFTGLRIAASVAQALSFAANIPVVSVSSLAIIAQAAFDMHQYPYWLVAVDARMGEIYWANYLVNSQGHAILQGEEKVGAPNTIQVDLAKLEQYGGAGDGWKQYCEQMLGQIPLKPEAIYANQLPQGNALLKLVNLKLKQGEITLPGDIIPAYLR